MIFQFFLGSIGSTAYRLSTKFTGTNSSEDVSFKKAVGVIKKLWKPLGHTATGPSFLYFSFFSLMSLLNVIALTFLCPGCTRGTNSYFVGGNFGVLAYKIAWIYLEKYMWVGMAMSSTYIFSIGLVSTPMYLLAVFDYAKLAVLARISIGIISTVFLSLVLIWESVIQSLLYFRGKSHIYQDYVEVDNGPHDIIDR